MRRTLLVSFKKTSPRTKGLSRVGKSLLMLVAVFIVGCNRITPSPSEKGPNASSSSDSPLTIRASDSPATGDSREPEINATPNGGIILSWVEKVGAKRYALRTSMRDGNAWSEARTVAEGENWFVNWADFPSVIALPDGSLAAHWLVKSGSGTYAYDVNIAKSKDGKTWSKPIVPHRDNTQTEHGFVSLIPLPDGRLGAVWLDGRNMKDMKHGGDKDAPASESMTLRYASVDADGKLSEEAQLDDRVCECCQTSAALTSEGAIAVYRDRSPTEVRDIYSVKQVNGIWTAPRSVHPDNWEINGCPVNGPAVAANGLNVVVAWFTEANDAPHVNLAFSNDAGATFGSPIQVDDGESVGRVDVILLPDGSALLCWLSGNAQGGAVKVRRVRSDGALGPPAVVAKTDISRSSGFPRMARLGDEVHFAWTEFGKPSKVRMATANIGAYK
ncbi:MAG TPA: sialidase family protein [Pyrinomonadaceae bacterium]|nr:sialidase family protein [Pyrinomonadaceae bacterium]